MYHVRLHLLLRTYLYRQTCRQTGSPEHRFCSVDSKTAEIFVCRDKLLYASAAESIDIVGSRPAMNPFIVVEYGQLILLLLLLLSIKRRMKLTVL